MFSRLLNLKKKAEAPELGAVSDVLVNPIGIIAGNGLFPVRFAEEAIANGRSVVAVCHKGETSPEIEKLVQKVQWIKVGELGRMIETFKRYGVRQVAMAGGINRIRLFGGVKLDARAAALLLRIKSAKDDAIMRGIAGEIEKEGIEIVDCTMYLKSCLAPYGILTKAKPTEEELSDIEIGREAIRAMSAQHIGQLVVVREGVIVAVEAVEGSDATILRGGELGGKGTVIVKCAKPDQDMRFDVPTVGIRTIETMINSRARVLAVEEGRCLIMDQDEMLTLADKHGICVIGCQKL